MPARLKTIFLTLFWLVVSALAILAFAGIISPHPIRTERTEIKLSHRVTGTINKAHDITFKTNGPVKDPQASITLDTSNRHAIISSLQLPGNLENIYIDTDRGLAFLANSFFGLQIIDISDPEHLRIIGSLTSPGKAWDIKVHGNVLFLASATGGLHLVDISDLETPTIISNLKFNGLAILGLEVVNKTVYAKTGKDGLLIIDVSNIKAPRLVKHLYSDSGTWGLLADENRLYVSIGRFSLEVLDISDPANPQITAKISLSDRAWDIAVRNNILYMPTRKSGLLIVDMRRPDTPELLRLTLDPVAYDHIALQDDRAYITSRTGKLSIIDLGNPIKPKLVGTFDLPERPRDIVLSGRIALVAAGIKGLQIIDTSVLTPTGKIMNLPVPGNLKHVLFDDNFFYLATSSDGLYIAEVDSAGEPGAIVAHLPLTGIVNNMVRIDNHLFFACSQAGLLIVDISQPTAPILVGKSAFAKSVKDLTAVGNHLFLAERAEGITVIDVKSPESPTLISQFPLHNPQRLTADESYLYVSTKSSIHIIDYSTPSALTQVGTLDFPWPLQKFTTIKQLTVAGKTSYLAAGPAGLISLDISNPKAPRLDEIINLDGDVHAINVDHNRLFALTRQGKLWLLHRDSDNRTSRRAVIDTLGIGYSLIPYGHQMVIANGKKGLTLLPLPQQIKIHSQTKTAGLTDTQGRLTFRIPPQSTPGIYNLNLFNQGELTEFIGAAYLRTAEE